MTDLALRAQDTPDVVLAEHPWLGAAIDDDALAGRFELWGASTVIDEHTAAPVIPRAVFDALHERAGLAAQWPIGNAGLLHTYGYLLSSVPTPYGLKRERWLDGALARAYGLPEDGFAPWARTTPLLARVTEAARGLLTRPTRLAEVPGGEAVLALGDAVEGSSALVYAVSGRLITTFPVTSASVLLEEWDADPGRLRWNAALEVPTSLPDPEAPHRTVAP